MSDSGELATLAVGAGELTIAAGTVSTVMPFVGGAIRVIVDARVIEVETDGRVAALVLAATESETWPHVNTGTCQVAQS